MIGLDRPLFPSGSDGGGTPFPGFAGGGDLGFSGGVGLGLEGGLVSGFCFAGGADLGFSGGGGLADRAGLSGGLGLDFPRGGGPGKVGFSWVPQASQNLESGSRSAPHLEHFMDLGMGLQIRIIMNLEKR